MVEEFDPNSIEEEGLRQMFITLMNMVESLSTKLAEKDEEIQRLRDEINRLKGEQGKPKIAANKASPDLSSEKQRRESKPHHKSSKQAQVKIDREVVVKVDQERLPADAVFKSYEDVVVQDIAFHTDNVKFRKEKYYSPGNRRTYLAELPSGYSGQFGPRVRALVLALYYESGMSEPKILDLLQTIGLLISAGQISDMLIKDQEGFHAERAEVVQAGLSSSPWQHLDSTGTRVNGHNQHCHVLCNPVYTAYCTLPSKDRLAMLQVLLGGAQPSFRLNAQARRLLAQLGVGKKWADQLVTVLAADQDFTQEQIDATLDASLPTLGPIVRKNIKDALAIAAYRGQSSYPVVDLLVCDDAPQFNWLTALLALCWIHEFRHYKKLKPRFLSHCHALEDFGKTFWLFYRKLLAYRQLPDQGQVHALQAQFDQLFTEKSGYDQLDECKARTLTKKEALLMVLSHPEILLHNNPAELGARQRVRKRDVSLQARTREGIEAWDTFQTLVATAKKLGVNIFHYLQDRILGAHALPPLATLIAEQAQLLALGTSWQQGP